MSVIRFFTDEDIYASVAPSLRSEGLDAISTPEAGRRAEDDESQLEFATQSALTIVTFNTADFARLHADWCDQGRSHSGIVVSEQRPVGDLLRRLKNLAQSVSAEAMQGRIEFLSSW